MPSYNSPFTLHSILKIPPDIRRIFLETGAWTVTLPLVPLMMSPTSAEMSLLPICSALEEAIKASVQANATKEHAEAEIAQIDAEVEAARKSAKEYIETLHKHEEETEKETEAWIEDLEQKELPAVKELQDSLSNLGVPKDQYSNMKTLAESLNNPVKSKNGKTYIEIPNLEATLPILKKMVHKVITAIEKVKNITDQVKEHVTRTRVLSKEQLAISKKEADRRNAERQAAEGEKGMVRKPEKSGPAL